MIATLTITPYGWAYLAVALILARVFAGRIWADELKDRRERPNDLFRDEVPALGCFMIGLVGGAIWPLVLAVWGFLTACERWPDLMTRIFFAEPSRARKERRLARQREAIERLEKELEL